MVIKYLPEAPPSVVADAFGRVRSGHFHAGALPGGEAEEIDFVTAFTTPEVRQRGELAALLPVLMQNLILRWLLDVAN